MRDIDDMDIFYYFELMKYAGDKQEETGYIDQVL